MMSTSLNIITVTKNDPEGVAATIASTRNLRKFPGVRQIIIDGSDELQRRKVQELLTGEESIYYLWQEPNGIAHAFNQGLSASDYGWIWFLNGRDEAHPDLDARFLLQILVTTQADILICELQYMQSGSRHKHPALWALWPPLYWVPHPATLVKRSLFDEYGPFRNEFKIAMDGELWVRLFSKDIPIDMLSIPISLYDQSGVSCTDTANVVREADRITLHYFNLLFKLWFKGGSYLFKAFLRKIVTRR
jgi:glycosyltransferase involved in cell wall biosynthesis